MLKLKQLEREKYKGTEKLLNGRKGREKLWLPTQKGGKEENKSDSFQHSPDSNRDEGSERKEMSTVKEEMCILI